MTFVPFDPLEFKNARINDAALGAIKREIENILSSYVGWYDPFCELIQNALDAVDARFEFEASAGSSASHIPRVFIEINLDENSLTVSDNGIGLDKDKFEQFLAPNFSFKTGNTRGHKGVGATYVAYGFNYMRISTKTPGFSASGRIIGARNWLRSNLSGANPKVEPDLTQQTDEFFGNVDRGVSVTVRFDETTHPKRLDWIRVTTAEDWIKILTIKTGLGAITPNKATEVTVTVFSKDHRTTKIEQGTSYLWLHRNANKKASFREISRQQEIYFRKYGAARSLSDRLNKLDFIYDTWIPDEITQLLGESLDDDEKEVIKTYSPNVSFEFGYTAKLWQQFNDSLGLRSGYKALLSGIQLAANNMPQGETIQIPLNRNIGRQNQLHFLFHFNSYTPDLGRKGFHRELTDFAKGLSATITEKLLSKVRYLLKANTGAAPDLVREIKIADWKRELLEHEQNQPLSLHNKHFFIPTERISITSKPTREQDVIALFHQLIAGGVIRGIGVMSTNERFIYDGLFKITFDLDIELYVYEKTINPLGVPIQTAEFLKGRVTDPRVLEYKFCLDGLVEDFDTQDKNIRDIDLCIVWSTGELYKERYGITSLLIPENSDQRQYHGVTHVLYDLETGSKHCDLIVLEELIDFLNDQPKAARLQSSKYE